MRKHIQGLNMFEWRLFDRIICYVWVWINDRYTWWKMKSPSTMHTYIKIKLYLKTMFVMFYKVFHYNLSAHFTMFENVDQVSLTKFDQVCNHDWNIGKLKTMFFMFYHVLLCFTKYFTIIYLQSDDSIKHNWSTCSNMVKHGKTWSSVS